MKSTKNLVEKFDWYALVDEEEKIHPKFKMLLRDEYKSERELFSEWLEQFHTKDGRKKTKKEFQTTFHSTLWEVYLNKVLLENGYSINKEIETPDFLATKDGYTICIEAATANVAQEGSPESKRTIDQIYGENDYRPILNESIARLHYALKNKHKNYKKIYSKLDYVANNPFIYGVGDYGQINYGQSFYYPLLALLYGAYPDFGDLDEYKILCEDNFGYEYKFVPEITASNGSAIPLGIFSDDSHKHISAIIYSCTLSLGKLSSLSLNHSPYPKCIALIRELDRQEFRIKRYSGEEPIESISDGLFIFHNPYSEKKLPDEFLDDPSICQIRYDFAENVINITCRKSAPIKRRFVCTQGTESFMLESINTYLHPARIKSFLER